MFFCAYHKSTTSSTKHKIVRSVGKFFLNRKRKLIRDTFFKNIFLNLDKLGCICSCLLFLCLQLCSAQSKLLGRYNRSARVAFARRRRGIFPFSDTHRVTPRVFPIGQGRKTSSLFPPRLARLKNNNSQKFISFPCVV